jgi:hypothetical protein
MCCVTKQQLPNSTRATTDRGSKASPQRARGHLALNRARGENAYEPRAALAQSAPMQIGSSQPSRSILTSSHAHKISIEARPAGHPGWSPKRPRYLPGHGLRSSGMPYEGYADPVMNDGPRFHSNMPISSAPPVTETADGVMHETDPYRAQWGSKPRLSLTSRSTSPSCPIPKLPRLHPTPGSTSPSCPIPKLPGLRPTLGSTSLSRLIPKLPWLRPTPGSTSPSRMIPKLPRLRLMPGSTSPSRPIPKLPRLHPMLGSVSPSRPIPKLPRLRLMLGSTSPSCPIPKLPQLCPTPGSASPSRSIPPLPRLR